MNQTPRNQTSRNQTSRNQTSRRELIVYATPTGSLATECAHYFDDVGDELGPTTAQSYPPHCTLTGFFRRTDAGVVRAIAEIGPVITAAGPVPADAVTVVAFHTTDEWVGLELRSSWLSEVAASIAAVHTLEPGDDALRLKDWLHLSLAYGTLCGNREAPSDGPLDLGPYGELAKKLVQPDGAGWELGLWERTADHSWIRHCQSP